MTITTKEVEALAQQADELGYPLYVNALYALATERDQLRQSLDRDYAIVEREDLTPVEKAIMIVWGERCPEHNDDCHTCRAWAQYDAVIARSERDRLEADNHKWMCTAEDAEKARDAAIARGKAAERGETRALAQAQDWRVRAARAEAEVLRLREALSIYASPGFWQDDMMTDPAPITVPYTAHCHHDQGEIARAALKGGDDE